jgi:hypothetical protein
MEDKLPNCWELEDCGREKGGHNVKELGECIASKEGLGHSCWAIAGTLCKGEIQGIYAKKIKYCTSCEIFKLYNRISGTCKKDVSVLWPEEDLKYTELMLEMNIQSEDEQF